MGLFSKSLEEKKLKNLTGGFSLNSQFRSTLKKAGIDLKAGRDIQQTVRSEIKLGKLSANDIERRLDYLVRQFSTIGSKNENEHPVEVTSPKERTLKFLINQEHNIKLCGKCKSKLLKSDSYCYNCGREVKSADESISVSESELNDLEKMYNRKVLHKSDNNVEFAYIVYLDYLNRNKSPKDLYDVSQSRLETRAIRSHHVINIDGLDSLTVDELREILKNNNLKVSGRKEELIERITLNKVEYNDKKLSSDAIELINSNRHILFYNNHPKLKEIIDIDKYADIFENQNKTNFSRIQERIVEYLNSQEYKALSNYEISRYRTILLILSDLYEMNNDITRAIESYFKIFITDLNAFSEYLKKAEPKKSVIDTDITDNLICLLDNNCIDSTMMKKLFTRSYGQLEILDPVISAEESLIYFLKIFNGADTEEIEKSIQLRFI